MKKIFLNLVRKILKQFNIGITSYRTLEDLWLNAPLLNNIKILQKLNDTNAQKLIQYYSKSKSQIMQDLFVLSNLAFKKEGYFVEFGATNGYDLSNTHLLEKEFGWKGILAEPAKIWHKDLKNNRSCNIETKCVWKDSGSILSFNEVETSELSTIDSFSKNDMLREARKKGKTYEVESISLNDLLLKFKAPNHIDYLSIDTEGSEYEILSNFDFSKYTFQVITCEHNFTPMREDLYFILTRQGYQRVFEDVSLCDDWYIKPNLRKL